MRSAHSWVQTALPLIMPGGSAEMQKLIQAIQRDALEDAAVYLEHCDHEPECLEGCINADAIRAMMPKAEEK